MRHSKLARTIFMFYIGFTAYISIEVLYRGHSHWSMGILGGICFLIIGGLNQTYTWDLDLILQMSISSVVITALELVAGLILNVWLGLGIWDYSNLHYQFMGQISLLYSLLWMPLSLVGIFLDDWLRHFLFSSPIPCYQILGFSFTFAKDGLAPCHMKKYRIFPSQKK